MGRPEDGEVGERNLKFQRKSVEKRERPLVHDEMMLLNPLGLSTKHAGGSFCLWGNTGLETLIRAESEVCHENFLQRR